MTRVDLEAAEQRAEKAEAEAARLREATAHAPAPVTEEQEPTVPEKETTE